MTRKHVTKKELEEAGARSRERSRLRDEARRLAAENAVLRGEVAMTDVDVWTLSGDVAGVRADRLYVGRALVGQQAERERSDTKDDDGPLDPAAPSDERRHAAWLKKGGR